MATNTIVKAQKEVFNEAVRGLVDPSVFTGVRPSQAQGSNFGYTSGGDPTTNVIDKFPFTSDANASDVGDLSLASKTVAGQSSSENGYVSGGISPSPGELNVIAKFSFTSDGNASQIGNLTFERSYAAGQSSTTSGYTSGGDNPNPVNSNIIDKFPFATDASASDVGDLTVARESGAGQSSTTHGYTSGGGPAPASFTSDNTIDKFTFASDVNASDVGDLAVSNQRAAGQNSFTHGYISGGYNGYTPTGPTFATIEKFPFSSDVNASEVGSLSQARYYVAGQSSSTYGYTSGGFAFPLAPSLRTTNIIDKFPFTSDGTASDVGDLTVARYSAAGQQY